MNFNKQTRVGITGGIGSGKSFVANVLEKMGYPVFYSDVEAKRIINTQEEVQQQMVKLLGAETFVNGQYNTLHVANIIFNNKAIREELNALIHPVVRQAFREWAKERSTEYPLVFNEAALMIESGSYQEMDAVILVTAPETIRVNRIVSRDNISEEQALTKLRSQTSDAYKRAFAQFEISNDGRAILPQILTIIDSIRP